MPKMKYIIFSGDGMGDYPIAELGGITPLKKAETPNMDRLAKLSCHGLLESIPKGMPAGSEVAILSLFGYDPCVCFTGRGALEAPGLGVSLKGSTVAFRLNLITVDDGKIKDYSAGHITTDEASALIKSLSAKLKQGGIILHAGNSYRHLLTIDGKEYPCNLKTAPPHDNIGNKYKAIMPKALDEESKDTEMLLGTLIKDSSVLLSDNPINLDRIKNKKYPANLIWPWSPGVRPDMKTYKELYGLSGAVISAVDIVFGIGHYAGFDMVKVKGATGMPDTDYEAKAEAAVRSLIGHDVVFVHVEGIDEASHMGDLNMKVKAIEDFDKRLIGNVLKAVDLDNTSIAVMPDHLTPVSTRMHAPDPVPFMLYRPGIVSDGIEAFDEASAMKGSLGLVKPSEYISHFLGISHP